jgi:hypothetical protein
VTPASGLAKPERANLPVLYQAQPTRRRGRRRPYQPKHAAPVVVDPHRKDRISMWLWAIVIGCSGFVAGTTALFNATVNESSSTFGSTALSAPGTPQTVTLKGTRLELEVNTEGSAVGGGSVGTRWRYYYPSSGLDPQGSSPSCDGATSSYTNTSQDLGGSTSNTKDQIDQPNYPGRWMCIMGFTTYPDTDQVAPATQWLSQINNPTSVMQLGHVVQTVTLTNKTGGTAGRVENGDTITVTFNQNVDATGRPSSGCVSTRATPDKLFIGPQTAGGAADCANNAPSQVTLLYLERSGSATFGSNVSYATSTWNWSDARTLVITLAGGSNSNVGSCTVTQATTGGGCWYAKTDITKDPSTALESAEAPTATLCTAQPAVTPDEGVCWPKTYGRF